MILVMMTAGFLRVMMLLMLFI